MLAQETSHRIHKDYFEYQTNFTRSMRVTLLCWMAEVSTEMGFSRITFHMAATYVDKYFETAGTLITTDSFQLIGVTSIFIAAKLEEIYVPDIKYFSQATGYFSSADQIRQMEKLIMASLDYKMYPMTLLHWADWYTYQWDNYSEHLGLSQYTESGEASFRNFSAESY